MPENATAVTTVTATDIDLQPLTYSIAGGADAADFSIDPLTGVLRFNSAPNFEAPADAGANNVYDVVVRVSDGAGGTDVQALSVTVTNVNEAPTARADTYVTDEDTALPVTAALGTLANDADEDLNPIAATLVAGPTNGTVALNADGSFVYTPNANFYGADSFIYRAHDGALDSADASVTITVNPINDAPVGADSNVTALATAYVFSVRDFGYGDVDGNPLDRLTITALPAVGQLLFDGVAVGLNQEITAAAIAAGRLGYVPPTTGSAIATVFGFRVSDGLVYESGSHAMTIGFAAALPTTPPPPPPAPDPVTPPPPSGPPAGPAAGGGGTGASGGGGTAPSGGGRGGGGGAAGGPTSDAGAPPAPAAEAGTQTPVAAVVATTVPPAPSVAAALMAFQSGGLPTDPRAAGPTPPSDSRGDPSVGEVKAAMEAVAAMAAPEVRKELDKLREQAREEVKLEARVAGSVFVVSTGLSVGYVLWLLRGGALIASLLSSLPAWRLVDPLPVLGSMGGRAGDEDDDSLEDLVAENGPPSEPGEEVMPHTDNAGSMQT